MNDWITPPEILKAYWSITKKPFDLDVASSSEANEVILADRFYIERGLDLPWGGENVLIFPPSGSVRWERDQKPELQPLKFQQELTSYSVPLARLWFDVAFSKWLNYTEELKQGLFVYAGSAKALFDLLTDSKREGLEKIVPVCLIKSSKLTWKLENSFDTRIKPECCAAFWFYPEYLYKTEIEDAFYDAFNELGRCLF